MVVGARGVDAARLDPVRIQQDSADPAPSRHGSGRGFLVGGETGYAEKLVVGRAPKAAMGVFSKGL